MIKPKDIVNKTMTPEKRAIAYNDFFAFYVGRPLSYVLTVPFLEFHITAKTVSIISMLFPIAGFLLFEFGNSLLFFIFGWLMFFVWNLLDGVDGNIARYTNTSSRIGSVYDAMSGYIAMVLTFFSAGVGAAHLTGSSNSIFHLQPDMFIVLGAFSGIFMLFPRLVMHKKISSFMNQNVVSDVKDKSSFGPVKILALNLSSVSGGAQLLLLVAIIFNYLYIYTIFYFLFNLLVMMISLKAILSE